MTKEEKFYKTLKDIFVGAKIEDKDGFVNLIKNTNNLNFRQIQKEVLTFLHQCVNIEIGVFISMN